MEADGIFVYGTLREGGRNHSWLHRTNPEGTCRAWAPGRLFHLPEEGFPAMVSTIEPAQPPPGQGWVVGEFIGFEDLDALDSALADLDQLEGVEDDLFSRSILPVVLESGHHYRAWVYVFLEDRLGHLMKHALEIPGGDWKDYLE